MKTQSQLGFGFSNKSYIEASNKDCGLHSYYSGFLVKQQLYIVSQKEEMRSHWSMYISYL